MQSRVGAGTMAGLAAGVVFGLMMQMMTAPTPDGGCVPMMMMVAQVVHSNSLVAGSLVGHLIYGVILGAVNARLTLRTGAQARTAIA